LFLPKVCYNFIIVIKVGKKGGKDVYLWQDTCCREAMEFFLLVWNGISGGLLSVFPFSPACSVISSTVIK
jgi:hypothetical protein